MAQTTAAPITPKVMIVANGQNPGMAVPNKKNVARVMGTAIKTLSAKMD